MVKRNDCNNCESSSGPRSIATPEIFEATPEDYDEMADVCEFRLFNIEEHLIVGLQDHSSECFPNISVYEIDDNVYIEMTIKNEHIDIHEIHRLFDDNKTLYDFYKEANENPETFDDFHKELGNIPIRTCNSCLGFMLDVIYEVCINASEKFSEIEMKEEDRKVRERFNLDPDIKNLSTAMKMRLENIKKEEEKKNG